MTEMPNRPKNWIFSDRFLARKFMLPVHQFTNVAASSGVALLGAAVAAMLWANLDIFGDSYFAFWEDSYLDLDLGFVHLHESVRDLVDDGLMAIFFFVMGLEIKRELVLGELRDPRKAVVPVAAAAGGMLFPALIYLALNWDDAAALRGWGIPMATDIAFAIGILALVGKGLPVGVRLFLLTVAIVDDVGAILVIALFYTQDLKLGYLTLGVAALAVTFAASRVNIRSLAFYVPMALIAWYGFVESGVHATLAGVVLGLITPARALYGAEEFDQGLRRVLDLYPTNPKDPEYQDKVEHEALKLASLARESVPPLWRLERQLHKWSAFIIVPLFALANTGVRLAGADLLSLGTTRVAEGVALGLVFGKVIGVGLVAWLMAHFGLGRLPDGVTGRHVLGVGMLAGVGFTVALFITDLAFMDQMLLNRAKLGIFVGSTVAGVAGALFLRFGSPHEPAEPAED